MKITFTTGLMLLFIAVCATTVVAQEQNPVDDAAQKIIKTAVKGCSQELETYCMTVTPGEGRMLACLYAHEDKLSGQCEYALFDAAVQLERAIEEITYLANECLEDFEKYCLEVPAGEGRLMNCLDKNAKKISSRCKQALESVVDK